VERSEWRRFEGGAAVLDAPASGAQEFLSGDVMTELWRAGDEQDIEMAKKKGGKRKPKKTRKPRSIIRVCKKRGC